MIKRNILLGAFLLAFVLTFSFASAATHKLKSSTVDYTPGVHINEVELNPNSGNEWVELYNDGPTTIDLTGWYLTDKGGNKIVNFTVTDFLTGGFYVSEVVEGTLVDSNEQVKLYNNLDVLQDDSGVISDSGNDDKTRSRVPDGNGSFVLQNSTKGITNILIVELPPVDVVISEKEIIPSCAFYDESINLKARVSGSCFDKVTFNVDVNGNLTNFTALKIGEKYSVTIPSDTFAQEGSYNWKVLVKDCYDRIIESDISAITLNGKTKLIVSPLNPDGTNGWYVSEPEFTLENPSAATIWYRWDNSALNVYTGPFGLENIPNNGSAGILELKWFSNVCSNETVQSKDFKIDLTNPEIKEITPAENATVYNNFKPVISAKFDDPYSNSGTNVSSAVLKVDDVDVTINATLKTKNGDGSISYTPYEDLALGNHSIYLSVEDKAGRKTEKTWNFEIKSKGEFEMNVYSPLDGSYNTTRINFNITTSEIVERIEFINYNEVKPKWRKLCVNCNSYDRPNTLKEGINNITIKAVDSINQIEEKNVVLYIDSKKPKISTTRPKSSDITNGGFFYVKYNENNLQKVELFWDSVIGGGSKVLENCSAGNNQECSTSLDLGVYNGKEITYWFEISDLTNKVESKKVKVRVDTNTPVLNIFMPENNESYWRNVPFNITVSEKVKIQYIDNFDPNRKWKTLCGNCESYGYDNKKNKPFKKGIHNLTIIAVDKAGNTGFADVSFTTEL